MTWFLKNMRMDAEWNEYIQSLSDKYGNVTNLIWISRKRRKYILDFAYSRILVINDEVYKFKDVVSCRIEKGVSLPTESGANSESCVVLIGMNNNTNMLVSITVWSKSVADEINKLIQIIIHSNKFF